MSHDNGLFGFFGEHSCMDGTPTLRMNEFILASLAFNKIDLHLRPTLPPITELDFDTAKVRSLIQQSAN